jgi:hypothetical protein
MDKLLKHALDDDAVKFVNRFKDKLGDQYQSDHADISKTVVADMAGLEPVSEQDEDDDGDDDGKKDCPEGKKW